MHIWGWGWSDFFSSEASKSFSSKPGLAIYAARGLRSGTAKLPQWLYRLRWLEILSKNEMRKLGIFQVASNVSLVAETGVQKKSVSMRKLKLRELNAENCVN